MPAWVVLGALLFAAGAELMYLGRGLTFNYDEWEFILFRQGHDAAAFLQPHNEHVCLVPIVIFKALFKVFGISEYWPYRLTNVLLVETCAALVYLYARRRIGAWQALVPAVLVGFMGAAAEDLFWPFEMSLEIPVGCAIAAFLLFDRGGRLADVAATALITVAVFCSGAGLAVLAAVAVEVGMRFDRRRRVWIVAVPALLYGAWWLGYHKPVEVVQHIPYVPRFDTSSLAASAGGLAGLDPSWGQLLAVALVLAVAVTIARSLTVPTRLVALCVLPLAYWTLIALARGPAGVPAQGRYLFAGGTFVMLVVVELATGRVPATLRRPATIVVVTVTGLICVASLNLMRELLPYPREASRLARAELGAVELARDGLPPDFALDQTRVPGGTVGLYLRARDAYGSPADTEAQLAAGQADTRKAADFLLIKGAQPAIVQGRQAFPTAGSSPVQVGATGGAAQPEGACIRATPSAGAEVLQVTLPARGIVVRPSKGAVQVGIRRFADDFSDAGSIARPSSGLLRIRPDRARRPWTVQVSGAEPFRVCSAG